MTGVEINAGEIEQKFNSLLPRLPQNAARYIKKFKYSGKLVQISNYKDPDETTYRPPGQILEDKIKGNIRDVIVSEGSKQAIAISNLIWTLNFIHLLSDEQLDADIYTLYKNWPDQIDIVQQSLLPELIQVSRLIEAISQN